MSSRSHYAPTFRIAGIDISVHWSWPVVVGLVLLGMSVQLQITHPDLTVVASLAMAAAGSATFFVSLVLHELAHALTARSRGIEVGQITMYLLGGATDTKTSSQTPGDELVVAIVGPLTSVALAVLLGLGAVLAGPSGDPLPDLLGSLAVLNLLLAAINMIPGLPLDGGRVVRAVLWAITRNPEQATRWASSGGVAIGYGLIGIGLLISWWGSISGLWLAVIGWTISQSARQSGRHAPRRSPARDLTAADVMTAPVVAIPSGATIACAMRDYFAHRNETVFPVVDDGRPIGLLPASAVRDVPVADVWHTPVEQVALHHQPALLAEPSTPLAEIVNALADGSQSKARVLVVDRDRLVGIISPTDVIRRHGLRGLMESAS